MHSIRLIEIDALGWDTDALEQFLIENEEAELLNKEKQTMENKEIIIWTQEECPLCQKVKDYYGAGNYTERNAQDLLRGEKPDTEAMAQLAMQDMQLPLIKVDGEWQSVNDIIAASESAA